MKLQCLMCGSNFRIPPCRKSTAKYCSLSCRGKAFVGKNNNSCSQLVRKKLRDRMLGELNPMKKEECKLKITGEKHGNWQGGLTELNKSLRNMKECATWRNAVFARDDYTCQECGKRGGILNADHIVPCAIIVWQYRITSRQEALLCKELWNVDNGRTLCRECHISTDTFGHKLLKNYVKNSS